MTITVNSNWAIVFGVLYCLDNAIWMIPGIQANNTIQLIHNIIVNLKEYFNGSKNQ